MKRNRRILICGLSGFLGGAIGRFLTANHYNVEPINRSHLDLPPTGLANYISGATAVLNFAGSSIARFWSPKVKADIYDSRILTTRKIAEAIKLSTHPPELFFNASATGIYDSYDVHDEFSTNFAGDFLSDVCSDWENEAFQLCQMQSVRVIIGRMGVVLDNRAGALPKMLKVFKAGIGGRIGDGYQCMPFIHIEDLLGILWFLLHNRNCKGIFNLVAPQMVSNREFSQQLARTIRRPNMMVVPKWLIRLIFGSAAVILAQGQKVVPKRLKDNHYPYEYPTIDSAIENLVSKNK